MQKEVIKVKKGLNIPLEGEARKVIIDKVSKAKYISINFDSFSDFLPKLLVRPGDRVKVLSPIACDNYRQEIVIPSPVSGQVIDIIRGEKRRVLNIVIENDFYYEDDERIKNLKFYDDKDVLIKTGLWSFIRQRPFNIIAETNVEPKAIFISAFDTSPLSPDIDFILEDKVEYIQAGIDLLRKITNKKIFVGLKADKSSIFEDIKGIEKKYFEGPHPVGNVGIQIHHVCPIKKGEIVFTIRPEDLYIIGKFILEKKFDPFRIIAITGSQLLDRVYIKTILGAQLKSFIDESNIIGQNNRFISGNVLTGINVGYDGYLGYYDRMITVIPEGNYYEFFGWLLPSFKKYSPSRLFFSWFKKNKKYILDTNLHGGERPFIFSDVYEKVLPMQIIPIFLFKAAITKNIEQLEKLGIYEIVEEDIALCEYVCVSKIELQKLIRDALNYIRKEVKYV